MNRRRYTIPGGGVMATATNIPVVKTQEGIHNSTHTSTLAASVAEIAAAIVEASGRTATVLSPIFGTSGRHAAPPYTVVVNTVNTNTSASNVVNNRYENNRTNINNRTRPTQ